MEFPSSARSQRQGGKRHTHRGVLSSTAYGSSPWTEIIDTQTSLGNLLLLISSLRYSRDALALKEIL
jgi:hypothetical protein